MNDTPHCSPSLRDPTPGVSQNPDPAQTSDQGDIPGYSSIAGSLTWPALGTAGRLAVGLFSAAVIAYELFVMRVFANGNWAHFGSLVIGMAMFGFGVFSVLLCLLKERFQRHLETWTGLAAVATGPAMLAANAVAQSLPFNPMFLISDPAQKWYLASYFGLYFFPFLAGAMFIGLIFLREQEEFGKIYFANMAGSGLGGLLLFGAMFLVEPATLFVVPLALWAIATLAWTSRGAGGPGPVTAVLAILLAAAIGGGLPQLTVSPYKGVSYARQFPDARLVYQRSSPFGHMEVFASSYFHFAPGLSDTAGQFLKKLPDRAFLGMYLDGDGPIGIMKDLPDDEAEYIRFLPMSMPYLLATGPEVFVMQFGGGISANVALKMGAKSVTVAESHPLIREAVCHDPEISRFTGRILDRENVHLIPFEGRIFLTASAATFDLVDLSLADSTGLSMPGGSSVQENHLYTVETFRAGLRALRPGGLFAMTVWNKEDPPKSTLRLLTTFLEALRGERGPEVASSVFVCHTYLSTLTLVAKPDGFTADEVRTLRRYCKRASFEIVYQPGQAPPAGDLGIVLGAYRNLFFDPAANEALDESVDMTAGALYRLAVADLVARGSAALRNGYVFTTDPLTADRPYLAGFVRARDLPRFHDKLEQISDEWGYLLLWATFGISGLLGLGLLAVPVFFGWRAVFARHQGKLGTVVYFTCLGLGYMFVELGLITKAILFLGNPTVSVSVLITGMLVFSGMGSYVSGRFLDRAGRVLTVVGPAIWLMTGLAALGMDRLFVGLAGWPYGARLVATLALLFPLSFCMGFPFALGMGTLARQRKDHFFIWAWGINGSFSTTGSVAVPLLAVNLGVSSVLLLAGALYLIAVPAFYALSRASPTAAYSSSSSGDH